MGGAGGADRWLVDGNRTTTRLLTALTDLQSNKNKGQLADGRVLSEAPASSLRVFVKEEVLIDPTVETLIRFRSSNNSLKEAQKDQKGINPNPVKISSQSASSEFQVCAVGSAEMMPRRVLAARWRQSLTSQISPPHVCFLFPDSFDPEMGGHQRHILQGLCTACLLVGLSESPCAPFF